MKKIIAYFFLTCCLTACQLPQVTTHHMKNQFDVQLAEKLMKKGNNSIVGNAFFRQRGGGVVTCAGSEVLLIPETAYSRERMRILYKMNENGANVNYFSYYNFIPTPPEYYKLIKRTVCDSSGHFKFDNITDGSFFVSVLISWETPSGRYMTVKNGGALMKEVKVQGGEKKEIIMTP